MAIGQSASFGGQRPISEITRADFTPVDPSEPLKLLPPGFEETPEAQQGIATYVKIFVLDAGSAAPIVALIRKLLEVRTVTKIAVALRSLDVPFLRSVSEIIPDRVRFGVCDYDAAQLKELLDAGVRVSFCSINADACCALPQDILALSRDTGIALIAHHDPVTLERDFGAAISRSISLYEKRQVVACTAYHIVE